MKYIFTFLVLLSSILIASNINNDKENREKNHIKEQIKKEQKYAKEQTFYNAKNYDFKSVEVDENSVKAIPDKPNINEGFDMDSVYD